MGVFIVKIFMQRKIGLVGLLLLLSSFSVGAVTHVRSISFEGNFVTDDSLLLREMYIQEGDELDYKKIEESVQAIMDLGLFKSVSYFIAEDYLFGEAGSEQADLVILLEEKYYLLIIPRIRANEDATHLGIQLRWDNMWGLNHQLRFLVEDRGTTAGIGERRERVRYNYPNVNGSRFSLHFEFVNQNNVDEYPNQIDAINRKDDIFGIQLSKWLNPRGRNKGWFTSVGFDIRSRENEVVKGLLQDSELSAVVLKMQYGFQDVHEYAYNRGGKEFGYLFDFAHRDIGNTNSEYFNHLLYYRSFYRFDSRPNDNLNVQTLFGFSTEDILGDAAYDLGSSQNLRGYESGKFEGNVKLLMNIEYLTPRKETPTLRYVYFIDVGNTYNSIDDIKHGKFKTGIGMGVRWKIKAFVKLDLRFDMGYGINDRDYQASFGTSHSF